jgi:hypothetical protein
MMHLVSTIATHGHAAAAIAAYGPMGVFVCAIMYGTWYMVSDINQANVEVIDDSVVNSLLQSPRTEVREGPRAEGSARDLSQSSCAEGSARPSRPRALAFHTRHNSSQEILSEKHHDVASLESIEASAKYFEDVD